MTDGLPPRLERRLGVGAATVANVLAMIGVGPFITIPLLLQSMQGPQAMLGWVIGAVIAICDGMVWAELGAALPESGGGYHYVQQGYGPARLGRLMSFLYLWQVVIVSPLILASGAVGFSGYAQYLYPGLTHACSMLLAAGVCLLAMLLIYRRIDTVGRLGVAFGLVILAAGLWIIADGALHARAGNLNIPPDAFRLSSTFWVGLGGATLYATYDYTGYQTVCWLGAEVSTPHVTIPRSITVAIVLVALLYLAMNISIIAVMPWQEAMHSKFVVSDLIRRVHGPRFAALMTVLILVITFAGLFAGMLGASRVPYAAAAGGHFFSRFARLHPTGRFPSFSVLYVGVASAVCCLLSLDELIRAGTVISVIIQSLTVLGALAILRRRRHRTHWPFRMWLYPLPLLVAMGGWVFILGTSGTSYLLIGLAVVLIGIAAYLWQAKQKSAWPWVSAAAQ